MSDVSEPNVGRNAVDDRSADGDRVVGYPEVGHENDGGAISRNRCGGGCGGLP